jgi:hypothetical protein
MRFRSCLGYGVYPFLAVLLFLPSSVLRAQDTSAPQAPGSSSSQVNQNPAPSQSQVLREAQERVNARRKVRIRQIIQDTYSHKYELDFGGAYLRFIPGDHLERVSEPGWQIDLTDYFHGDLGISADFRGYYGTAYTGTTQYSVYNPGISEYTFMAGPRYRFFKGQHWGWTGQVLAGIGHGNFGTGTNGLPPQLVGLYTDGNVLYISPGASADYNLSPALAIRWSGYDVFTDYSSLQQNLGGGMGIVYRFGRK